jgi:putative membrane protein
MQILFLIFSLIIAFFAILFAVQNTDPVTVHFLGQSYEQSLAMLLFSSLLVGALIVFLVTIPSLIKNKVTISRQRKKANQLETNLTQTRSQLAETQTRLVSVAQNATQAAQSVDQPSDKGTDQTKK